MRNKLSVSLLCTALVCCFLMVTIASAADVNNQRTWTKKRYLRNHAVTNERPPADARLNFDKLSASIALGQISTQSPGEQAGLTTYDYQHNGTMARQIAFDESNNMVHFVWMAQDNYIIPGNRGIKYQSYDTGTNSYNQALGGEIATSYYSGYCTTDATSGGAALFSCHTTDVETEDWYNSCVYKDAAAGFNIFQTQVISVDPTAEWYTGTTEGDNIWPVVENHQAGGGVTEDVVYVLAHVWTASEHMILYRDVGADGTFDNGTFIDKVTDLSYTVVADRTSDSVYIVYTDDRWELDEGDGGQTDLDVWYQSSPDQGVTWHGPFCVSNYTEDSLWRAYSDLSAIVSSDGELHIMWPARELKNADDYEDYKARLMHWSTDVSFARIVSEARYEMYNNQGLECDAGVWNMYIAKNCVSECDGKLYALWTQFGASALNDCSISEDGGYANGELLLAVSDDNGLTWDIPQNLTNSPTPDCDSGTCDSDHWSSMVRYGMVYGDETVDDTLDLVYINDKSAGGIPQGEGCWIENQLLHLRVPCRAIIPSPKVSLEPNNFEDPTHTAPGDPLDTSFTVINTGNALLTAEATISYIDGADWAQVEGGQSYAFTVASGANNTLDIDVTLNVGGAITDDPSGWDAEIIITSDAPTTPDIIPIHLTVASDFSMPSYTTLATETKSLRIYNTARFGGDTDGESLNIPWGVNECDTVDDNPATEIYLYDASPMLGYNDGDNITYTTIFTQSFTEDGTFRPQSGDIVVTSETDYTLYEYTVSTSDSTIAIDMDVYGPTDADFVVGVMTVYPWKTGVSVTDLNIGYIIDWDIPSDSSVDNGAGYDASRNTVWQYGREGGVDNDEVPCDIDESDRIGGIAYLSGTIATAWTHTNSDMQQGSAYNPDSLMYYMGLSGYNMFTYEEPEDSLDDLHMGVVFEKTNLGTGDSFEYVFALATTNTGMADYLGQIDAAAAWAADQGLISTGCCVVPGDANGDGSKNIADASYIINKIFFGGADYPCTAEADANADGNANIADASFIINSIFFGGPQPTCGPE